VLPCTPSTRACLAALFALLVAPLPGCEAGKDAAEPIVRPVRVFRVAPVSAVHARTFPGRAQAETQAALSFKVPGQIKRLVVSAGDAVRQGDLISELDDQELQLELRRAEASHAEAAARERITRSKLKRMKVLFDEDAASRDQLDETTTNWESARAGLQAQTQSVALARSELAHTKIVAPEDGLIASVPVNVNENVSSGETVVTLNYGALPEVAFAVPGSLIRGVSRGQPLEVRFTSLEGVTFPAEILEVGIAAGRTAYPVTARLIEADDRIRSGMVAEVSIRLGGESVGEPATSIIVPAHAIAEDRVGRFAFVARPDSQGQGVIERHAVTIGEIGLQGLEVVDGLEPGDLLVTAGIRFVEPGMTVRILED